jgi:hypothetical protein
VIVLKHANKYGLPLFVVYGHVAFFVSVGSTVRKGQVIGRIVPSYPSYNAGQLLLHLHLGCYIGLNFPTSGWGYSDSLTGWKATALSGWRTTSGCGLSCDAGRVFNRQNRSR